MGDASRCSMCGRKTFVGELESGKCPKCAVEEKRHQELMGILREIKELNSPEKITYVPHNLHLKSIKNL